MRRDDGDGQPDRHDRAAVGHAVDRNRTAVEFDEPSYQHQTETGALVFSPVYIFQLSEWLHQFRNMLCGDADTGIGNGRLDSVVRRPTECDRNAAAARRELEGVRHEVE